MNSKKIYILFVVIGLFLQGNLFGQKTVNHTEFTISTNIIDEPVNENKAAHTIDATPTRVSCFGLCDGEITVTIIGGPPVFPINLRLRFPAEFGLPDMWYNGLLASDFPFTISGLCGSGAPYEVRTRDSENTWSNNLNSVYVLAPAALDVIEIITEEVCAGACDGSIVLDEVNGGTMPYVFAWSNGESTQDISNLCSGNYNLTLTDDNLCVDSFSFSLAAPPTIILTPSQTNVLCRGDATGIASVVASNGTPLYTYDWSPNGFTGDGTDTYSDLPAGNYTVTVTDANSCTASIVINITQPATVVSGSVSSQTNVLCTGSSTGSVTVTGAGGTPGYTYSLDGGPFQGSGTFNGLAAGPHIVTVMDSNGCTTNVPVNITEPPVGISGSITSQTNVLCFGQSTGSVTVAGAGGNPPYTYSLDGGAFQGSGTFNGLAAGPHTVTVKDASGCTVDVPVNITEPAAGLTGSIIGQTDILCFGLGTGSVTVAGADGTPGYTYSLDGGAFQGSGTFNGLLAGPHTVTVRDANGCTFDVPVTITEPASAVSGSISAQTNVLCFGQATGSVTVDGAGGTPGYTYSLDGGAFQGSGTFNGLSAGAHVVTVMDANGCTVNVNVNITQPALDLSGSITLQIDILCFGQSTGSVTVAGAGGTPGYTYSLDGGAFQGSGTFNGLSVGAHTVTIMDANNCTINIPVNITEPPTAVSGSISGQTDILCFGMGTGSVTVAGAGGTPGYTYAIDGGAFQGSGTFNGLTGGPHTVTVMDANGCTVDVPVNIVEPPLGVSGSISAQTDVLCFGMSTGSVTVDGAGGTPGYTYSLDGGAFQGSGTFNGLSAGAHVVTVMDANGCTSNVPVNILQPPSALSGVVSSQTDVLCFGQGTGSVTVTGQNGTPGYTYSLDGGAYQGSGTFNGLSSGAHIVTVMDANGCTFDVPVNITEPATAVSGSITAQTDVLCFGQSTGSVTVLGSNGTPGYTYSLDGGAFQGSGTFNGLSSGPHTVTVKDANGCTFDVPVLINPAIALSGNITAQTDVICFGQSTGSVTVAGAGGTPGYTYSLDGGAYQGSGTFNGLSGGAHIVTVKDANGCTVDVPVLIVEPPIGVTGSISAQTDVLCFGQNTGSVTVDGAGGTPGYTYSLDGGAYQGSGTFNGLSAGAHVVTVMDANGCTSNVPINIIQPPSALSGAITSQTNVLCFGQNTGSVTVNGIGGSPGYTYSLDGGPFQGSGTFNSLIVGAYVITIMDVNGCTFNLPVNITEPATAVSGSITAQTNVACFGQSTGSVTVAGAGGTPGYTYSLDGGAFQPSGTFNGLPSGPHTVTVKDANGCTVDVPVNITEPTSSVSGSIISQTNVLCFGMGTGDVTVDGAGGTPGYTYSLDGGAYQGSGTFNGLSAGPHTVTVMDANGCTANVLVNITEPATALSGSITAQTNVNCFGQSTGSVSVAGSDGTPGYTYSIDGGAFQGSGTFNGLSAGPHTVTVMDANGCLHDVPVIITPAAALTGNIDIQTNILCFGQNNGSVTISGAGGTPGYTYSLDGGAYQPSGTFNSLSPGAHTITVKDANGCTTDVPINITEPAVALDGSISGQIDILCFGQSTGSVSVAGSNGTPGYTYSIDGGAYQPSGTFNGLVSGPHTVTIQDANGCTFDVPVNISEPTAIDAISSQTDVVCFGEANGVANVSVSGGTGSYTYNWSPDGFTGDGTDTYSDLIAGLYDVTISDANSCSTIVSFTIIEPLTALSASVSNQIDVNCLGEATGSVTASVSGGTPNYSYDWSPNGFTGDGTDTYSDLIAGNYDVTITDSHMCTTTMSVTITEPLIALSSLISDTGDVNCNGGNTGFATVTASGGTPNYSYDWFPNGFTGEFTNTYSNLTAGIYFVTVTDGLGCTSVSNVEIQDTSNLQFDLISSTNPLCFGDCNGNAIVLPSGGLPPYNITWPVGFDGTNLCDGNYIVTVEDANFCSRQLLVQMNQPQPLSFTTTSTSPLCFNDCNGTATATPMGGTWPYTYQWSANSGSQTDSTAVNLCADSYDVTVSDANGCPVAPQQVIVNSPPILSATLDITQSISCNGVCDGVLMANPLGGTSPYTYEWFPNVSESSFEADTLCADNYSVTVTDFNGCSVVATQTLTQPNPVTATILSFTDVFCNGDCSGQAVVEGGGGTPGYTYLWDVNTGDQTNDTAINLCANIYFVTVSDLLGCTASTMVTIVDTSTLALSVVSAIDPLCFGQCNGSISVIATGGYPYVTSPNYTFSWSNDPLNTLPDDNGLCSGDYIITVLDSMLCSRTILVPLIDPPLLQDSTGSIPITCSSFCDGSAIVYPYGGTLPYSFEWDGMIPQYNDTASNLCDGTYHITITDGNDCVQIDSVTLVQPPALTVNLAIVDNISCNSDCNGSVVAIVSGGTPGYSYQWNVPQINDTIIGLCAGTYDVTISDAGTCTATASITLDDPDTLQISFTDIVQVACGPGNCTGGATAVVTGGTPLYTYLWDVNAGNQTDSNAVNLCANIYNVTATDARGCTIVGTVAVTDISDMVITITDTNHVTCSGACDGSAMISVTGGTPGPGGYNYQWSVPALNDTTVINLCQGTYSVTVTDQNFCSRIATFDITDAAALTASNSVTPQSCTGNCDAEVSIIPSGGTPFSGNQPYTYEWSIGGLTDSTATGLCPGTYYYTVTDNNNCQYNDSVTIVDPGSMQANISIVDPILCHGVCIGSLLSTPSGSVGPYTYSWSDGQTDSLAINLCAGQYYVTVNGQGGCSVVDSITLTEPDTMTVTFVNIVNPLCNGDSTGSITAFVIGGTPIYFYQWDANADNATTAMVDTLIANLYFITVTDANGCSQSLSYELSDTSNIEITVIDSSMVSCYNRCDGWVNVLATGGTPSVISPFYNYTWSDFQTGQTANNLCAGSYIVTATDSLLCVSVKQVEITQPDSIIFTITDSTSIACATICDGSLTVSVSGGTQPFTYLWNNNGTDSINSNLCIGLQQLNITDNNFCTDSLLYYLNGPDTLQAQITAQNALCSNGSSDGNLLTNVTGGVQPYTFLWSNDSITQDLMNAPFGNYWITITDANGCQKIDSSEITASIIVDALARWDTTICYGDSVQIFGFGGNVFSWSPGMGLSDSTVYDPWASPTETTTYYFTARDSICFDVDSVTVQVYPQLIIDAGPDLTIFEDHGTIISATSNDPLATYLWIPNMGLSDSTALSPFAEPDLSTTYVLFATNAFGCVEVDTMVFTVISKIPNGITPNGDGDNDVWMLDIVSKYPDCEVEIYNRWGEQLFYSRGYPDSERWDGTYKGKPLPTGTYYYIINLHDSEESILPITGPITILR